MQTWGNVTAALLHSPGELQTTNYFLCRLVGLPQNGWRSASYFLSLSREQHGKTSSWQSVSVGFPLLPEFRAEKLLRECALRAAVGRCARLQRLSHAGQQQRCVHAEDPCPTSVASGSRLSLQVLWRALGNTCFGPVLFSARLGDATCCPRAMSFVVATSQFKNAPSRTEFRNSWSVPTVSAQPNASKNSAEDLTMRWRWCRKLTRSRQENAAGRRSQSRRPPPKRPHRANGRSSCDDRKNRLSGSRRLRLGWNKKQQHAAADPRAMRRAVQ